MLESYLPKRKTYLGFQRIKEACHISVRVCLGGKGANVNMAIAGGQVRLSMLS